MYISMHIQNANVAYKMLRPSDKCKVNAHSISSQIMYKFKLQFFFSLPVLFSINALQLQLQRFYSSFYSFVLFHSHKKYVVSFHFTHTRKNVPYSSLFSITFFLALLLFLLLSFCSTYLFLRKIYYTVPFALLFLTGCVVNLSKKCLKSGDNVVVCYVVCWFASSSFL